MTQIVFCAEYYMSNKAEVEKLIEQAFPAPKYSVISLVVHPDHVAEQVNDFFRKSSNQPALFFYWDCLNKRADESYIWRPLFDRCKAVAHLSVQQDGDVVAYWQSAWKRSQMYRVVVLDPQQQFLTPEQQSILLEVCNVEVKNSLDRSRYYIFGLVALAALALIGLLFQKRGHIFRHTI